MQTILSYGLGVESSAILINWLDSPSTCPCQLHELIVITAQTGDEYEDTRRDVEAHILPRLRKHNIRYVQVARKGHLQADGITVLSDARQPQRLYIEGDYKLSDELRAAGTLPQFAGEQHRCSLKFKAWVIEQWLAENLIQPALHAFGYNAEETRRVAKSDAATARRIAFGFNADETKRIGRATGYDTPLRQSFYPLVEWGWTRQTCIDYLRETLGVIWRKSSCTYCPFNALKEDALVRHKQHPEQVADAMVLEHVSLSLNPRGTLYRNRSLIEIADASGNRLAVDGYRQRLDRVRWAVYRVRRLYHAGKDASGQPCPEKKGNAIRAVERLLESDDRAEALVRLRGLTGPNDEVVEQRGITYVYRRRCGATFPTREEFLVAAPAVVESKARYGLEWFEQEWGTPQQGSLFEGVEIELPSCG
jgi:hypothetical protein